jgi:hypothetical protein
MHGLRTRGGGNLVLSLPEGYLSANAAIPVLLMCMAPVCAGGQNGFLITALSADGAPAGTLQASDGVGAL